MSDEVDNKVKMIVEGLLLAAGRPLSLDAIMQVFSRNERPDRKELRKVLESIANDCNDRGFELSEVASGYRFQVKQELSEWISKLWEEKPPRYTRALLETLALIAYRQPITRGDIEEIRGVAVSTNIIRTLLDREWIRVVGHRDVPGRPAMFATTREFLDYFDLKSLEQLPPLAEVKELDKSEQTMDLEDDLANQRILDMPEEDVEGEGRELSEEEQAELIAEEEAVELARKPLDEILLHDPVYGKAAKEAEEAARAAEEAAEAEDGEEQEKVAPADPAKEEPGAPGTDDDSDLKQEAKQEAESGDESLEQGEDIDPVGGASEYPLKTDYDDELEPPSEAFTYVDDSDSEVAEFEKIELDEEKDNSGESAA